MGVANCVSERRCSEGGNEVLGFEGIDQTQVALVGGKGASLGDLARIDGIRVPRGFCVTTDAFRRIMASTFAVDEALDGLTQLEPGDRDRIRTLPRSSSRPSKRSRYLTIWPRRSSARWRGSASTLPTRFGRARRQRTCPPHPSWASKTRS